MNFGRKAVKGFMESDGTAKLIAEAGVCKMQRSEPG